MGLRGKKASLDEKEVGQVLRKNTRRGPGGMARGLLISCCSRRTEGKEGKERPVEEYWGRKVGSALKGLQINAQAL